jgi:type I restriction-modification system DNA methylase subunit
LAAYGKGAIQIPNASALGFEARVTAAADNFRGNLDASKYKRVILGLIVIKFILPIE